MALVKQKIAFPLTSGIDSKNDPKQVNIGVLEKVENVHFDTPGKLQKVTGFESLTNYNTDNDKIDNFQTLAPFKNELNALTNTTLYSYSDSIQKWTDKGTVLNITSKSDIVLKNEKEQSELDCLYVENTKIFVYKDSTGIKYSVVDRTSNSNIVQNKLVSSTGASPRLANIGNNIFIFYYVTTHIYFKRFSIIDPSNLSVELELVDDLSTHPNFDTVSLSNNTIIIGYNSTGDVLATVKVDSSLNVLSATAIGGESASTKIDLTTNSDKTCVIITYYNGTDIKLLVKTANLAHNLVAPTIVETINNVTNATTYYNNQVYQVYYEISAAQTYNYYLKRNTVTSAAVVGTPEIFIRSVGLAGKLIEEKEKLYIPVLHNSTLQSTYFLLDESAKVINYISSSLSGSLITVSLPKFETINSTTFLLPTQVKGRIVTDNGEFDTLLGVNSTEFSFNQATATQSKILGENLHIASGTLYNYDGIAITEHGFFLYPENLSGSDAATGGSMSDGTYQYCATYSYTDNKGQQQISTPSVPVEVIVNGGGSSQSVTVVIPTLKLTNKNNIIIDLYRTENAGTIFYRVTSINSPVLNDITVDTISIVDTITDTALVSRETLYTTGDVLENTVPPQSSIIESFKNRIFLAGLNEENRIVYSKIRTEGKPVEFNDTLILDIETTSGPITALKKMDDKLVIFKEDAIYYLSGDGPNNLGEEDNFITPELISSDLGCINSKSIVLTPSGVFFQSKKGIYILGRDLSISYIGAMVERYNNLTITAANIVSNKNIIRFSTSTGLTLTYNYFVEKWSVRTNSPTIDAKIVDDVYYYIRNNSEIYKENSSYSDNGTPISLKIETGWLNFATVQGFQRIYRMNILGDFKSAHKLKVRVAYDYKEAFVEEVVIDSSDFTSGIEYGNTSPYGTDEVYGTSGNLYQLVIKFKKQKCKAMKISIEDIPEDTTEGISLSNLLFFVGIKEGYSNIDGQYGTNQ